MNCGFCGKSAFINYGDAYTDLCKACHGTEAAEALLKERRPAPITRSPQPLSDQLDAATLATLGFLVGGFLGFLLRPSVPLIGQLPFFVVMTRGAGLGGLDQVLVPYAQNSFNIVLVGAIIGAVIGVFVGHNISQNKAKSNDSI